MDACAEIIGWRAWRSTDSTFPNPDFKQARGWAQPEMKSRVSHEVPAVQSNYTRPPEARRWSQRVRAFSEYVAPWILRHRATPRDCRMRIFYGIAIAGNGAASLAARSGL